MRPTSGERTDGTSLRRILVVEDELLIALDLKLILTESGFGVIGPVATVARALALLASARPDAAVLDVNLRGQPVTPVAEVLRMMRVPFVVSSAYGDAEVASNKMLASAPSVGKPVNIAVLLGVLRDLLDRR